MTWKKIDSLTHPAFQKSINIFQRTTPIEATRPSLFLEENLAYILYTSGSTGEPKGVAHTHDSALAFIDWCLEQFQYNSRDVFSSHAPFHFDLSIHDLFVPLFLGAKVVLISEASGKVAPVIEHIVRKQKISVWYSTPTVLRFLLDQTKLFEGENSLKQILFAGETFPLTYLERLCKSARKARLYNLFGPTETNVCTFYEIPPDFFDKGRSVPPIGQSCAPSTIKILQGPSERGELWVSGKTVSVGYWNRPAMNADRFETDENGLKWYKTGDIVSQAQDGNLIFHGRNDRMVKRRGYRIELDEIEHVLSKHSDVLEARCTHREDEERGTMITAHCVPRGKAKLSAIGLRQFCARELPLYMIPDEIVERSSIPLTLNHKVDYQKLTLEKKDA